MAANIFEEALHPRGFHGRFSSKVGGPAATKFRVGAARGRADAAARRAERDVPGARGMSPEEERARARGLFRPEAQRTQRGPKVETPEERRAKGRAAGSAAPSGHSGHEPAAPSSNHQERLHAAYRDLVRRRGNNPDDGESHWVQLADLREHPQMAGMSRQEQDTAILHAFRARSESDHRTRLVPESNQKALTQQDRKASMWVGNQDKHLISISPPKKPSVAAPHTARDPMIERGRSGSAPKAPAKKTARSLMAAAKAKAPEEHVATIRSGDAAAARAHAETIKGKELDALLQHAGVSRSGTVAQKRDRLVEHLRGGGVAKPAKVAKKATVPVPARASAPPTPSKTSSPGHAILGGTYNQAARTTTAEGSRARGPQGHIDHLEDIVRTTTLENRHDSVDEAKAYIAGIKGKELDAVARHYHVIGGTAAFKRERILSATVRGYSSSLYERSHD